VRSNVLAAAPSLPNLDAYAVNNAANNGILRLKICAHFNICKRVKILDLQQTDGNGTTKNCSKSGHSDLEKQHKHAWTMQRQKQQKNDGLTKISAIMTV